MSDMPGRISLREVGPRDGLQNEDPVPTEAKIELIDRLSATGVQRIEAVSFVRPEAIPQMADADAVWQGIERAPSVRYSALVPNLRGARRALDRGLTEIEAVVSASDTHNRKNVNRSTAESLDEIAEIVAAAVQRYDADDRDGMAVEKNRFPDNRGVSAEASMPIVVTQNDYRIRAGGLPFGTQNETARGRRNAQQ